MLLRAGRSFSTILSNSGARLLVIETDLLEALDHVDISGLALERIWMIGGAAPTSFDRIAATSVAAAR